MDPIWGKWSKILYSNSYSLIPSCLCNASDSNAETADKEHTQYFPTTSRTSSNDILTDVIETVEDEIFGVSNTTSDFFHYITWVGF